MVTAFAHPHRPPVMQLRGHIINSIAIGAAVIGVLYFGATRGGRAGSNGTTSRLHRLTVTTVVHRAGTGTFFGTTRPAANFTF